MWASEKQFNLYQIKYEPQGTEEASQEAQVTVETSQRAHETEETSHEVEATAESQEIEDVEMQDDGANTNIRMTFRKEKNGFSIIDNGKFECQSFENKYSSSEQLQIHMKNNHIEESGTSFSLFSEGSIIEINCQECGNGYESQELLKQHMRKELEYIN